MKDVEGGIICPIRNKKTGIEVAKAIAQ